MKSSLLDAASRAFEVRRHSVLAEEKETEDPAITKIRHSEDPTLKKSTRLRKKSHKNHARRAQRPTRHRDDEIRNPEFSTLPPTTPKVMIIVT
mmetsp:Transcript_30691/g.98910  ORF Transcript_30691/g.98910 Transcript_30691/m.98910 type:complete len:93 (-) Transcript_30691:330-608(-)